MSEPERCSESTGTAAIEAALFRQQTTLARFGEFALKSQDLDEILTEACRLVGEALGTDLAKVMEVRDEGMTLLVRAGLGWCPGIVGQKTLRTDEGTSEAYALRTGEPLVCPDVATETRFKIPDFVIDHGVKALVLVLILGGKGDAPFGVLQVDSKELRQFTEHDIAFLRSYANLLAAAVDRLRLLNETRRERDLLWASSDDLLIAADFQGRSVKINPAWWRVLGWTEQDLAGEGYTRIVHPDDLPAIVEAVRRLREDRTSVSVEDRVLALDGSWHRVAWKLSPSADGDGLTGIGRDVTAEREQETRLRDQQDFTRLALSAVGGVGVWTFDALTDTFSYDAAIAKLYAIDPERGAKGIPRNEFLANVHPDDRVALVATMSGGLHRPGDLELEYRLCHPDGSVHWVLSRGHTYLDDEGRPVRRTGVGVETTNQRQTEEALRQSQKMEAVGQLTGGVAHDFNNLLTIIRSSIDFLRRPDLPDARKGRYLDAVSETVDRAAKLTGQLLAFARRQALTPEVFDVGAKMLAIADMLDTVTGARVRVLTQVPEAPCFVRADLSQFETALVNMAVNARDAMDGAGTLTLRLTCGVPMPPIRGHAGSSEAFTAVSLTDTGAGIAAEQMGRIFEPFFTTKEVGKGTGLGLSQVFGFAKQSGGDVDVASTPGQGTTFMLYLPQVAVETGELSVVDDDGGRAPVGRGQRVLVVEDNIDVGRFCTQILEDLGYQPTWAANAEEALEKLGPEGAGFDAVFSDVVMPGMGGLELARELRRRLPDLPVVLASGYSHVLAMDDAHGFELLHKPYSAEQLSKVLRRVTAGGPGYRRERV